MAYNMTNISEANDFYEVVMAANELTGDLYANVILLAIFLISFIVLKNHDTRAVFVGTSFFVAVISALFFFADFTSWKAVVIPVVLFIGSIIYLVFNN
jgi:hypothetical protein|tara:strand:+ start:119 stop:412 length:294 start_codon:yes stop_codon:yes gene_type:complete